MPDDVIRRRVRVTGRVQGVGFRESCRAEARRVGVAGEVRNQGDGSVEATFEGRTSAVEHMVEWCRHGPRLAHVRAVDVSDETPSGAQGFTIAFR